MPGCIQSLKFINCYRAVWLNIFQKPPRTSHLSNLAVSVISICFFGWNSNWEAADLNWMRSPIKATQIFFREKKVIGLFRSNFGNNICQLSLDTYHQNFRSIYQIEPEKLIFFVFYSFWIWIDFKKIKNYELSNSKYISAWDEDRDSILVFKCPENNGLSTQHESFFFMC